MNHNSQGQAVPHSGRFDFRVAPNSHNVTISRPVSPEDVERLRRQLAEWEARRNSN